MSASHLSGPIVIGTGRFKALTAAYTVTYDDDGKTFYLGGGTGFAITMPAYKAGFTCKFKVTAAFSTDYVITFPAAIVSGPIIEAGVVQVCAAKSVFTLEDDAEALGDYLEFEDIDDITCVNAAFQTAASITVA
jgi:hypothetical protein